MFGAWLRMPNPTIVDERLPKASCPHNGIRGRQAMILSSWFGNRVALPILQPAHRVFFLPACPNLYI